MHRLKHICGIALSAGFLVLLSGCATVSVEDRKIARYKPRTDDRSPWLWEKKSPRAGDPAPATVKNPPKEAPVEKPPPKVEINAETTRILRRGDSILIHLTAIPRPEDVREVLDERGTVTLPLIGDVEVEGLTTAAAERAIQKAYISGGYYNKIDVIVVADKDEYFVRGEVKREGRYPLAGDLTLIQAITSAGGYTDYARSKIKVIRGKKVLYFNSKRIELRKDEDPLIEPGDIIVVLRRIAW